MTTRTIDGATVTIVRVFGAPVETIWDMWTTIEGLNKWYWPPPMAAKVIHLDVRVGGSFVIGAHGSPLTSRGTYTEVVPHQRLKMRAIVDFIPEIEPYDRIDLVEFEAAAEGTKMSFTCTRMHSPEWQGKSLQGWYSSFDKLERALDTGAKA